MSASAWARTIMGILAWIAVIWGAVILAAACAAVLAGLYRKLLRWQYRRQEQDAQEWTLRARHERLLRNGRPMGALHPEHGPAMSREERIHLRAIENHLTSEGQS